MNMTVRDLYEKAKAKGLENAPLTIDYQCNDDWYSYCDDVHEEEVLFMGDDGHYAKEVCIAIEN